MESARESSGIYDHDPDFEGSTASLAGHAALPAGSRFSEGPEILRTTAAGVPVGPEPSQGTPTAQPSAADQPDASPQKVAPSMPWYKTRKFIISQAIIIPLGIALLFILLFPVVTTVVQSVVDKSVINVNVASITELQNNTFNLALSGVITHTGVISARIEFTQPTDVYWVQDNGTEIPIGSMWLHTLLAKDKRAAVDEQTVFNISDEDAFGSFAQHMITGTNFTWKLSSDDLKVQAAKFPLSHGIKFNKYITLNGFNSFDGNTKLTDLQLPSDNPNGGINFVTITTLFNPSPFSLNLGTVVFDLFYKDIALGVGTGEDTKIVPGDNNISLGGYLIRHNSADELVVISELFTNYLNGDDSTVIAKGQSTLQNDGTAISWLTKGVEALELQIPFVSLQGAINPIQAIEIGDLGLLFDTSVPWSPITNSKTVQAQLALPFGFSVSIGQIQNSFNLTRPEGVVGGLDIPLDASTSHIKVYGEKNTSGPVDIVITDTRLATPDHPVFADFNVNITSHAVVDFQIIGHSRSIANTSIGQITLGPIKFNVTSSLKGLQGLNGLTNIEGVDVRGGTEDGITLSINVMIYNPSNLYLQTGDLHMQLKRDGVVLGTALMPNLTLNMGNNTVVAQSTFAANDSPQGLQTLDDFVGRKDVQLSIVGYDGSTEIASLSDAFRTLDIGVVLPGLNTTLLNQAALEVLSTTGRENNISHVSVIIQNPFTAALGITNIRSTVSSAGLTLGMIESSSAFTIDGKSTATSPELDLNMNMSPSVLFSLTRKLAVVAGLDTAQLDGIVSIGGISYVDGVDASSLRGDTQRNIYTGFNLPQFVQQAFSKLETDVNLTTGLKIGDYSTTLEYTQSGVKTNTDDSLDLILPILAQPIVQKMVSQSLLSIDNVLISDPQPESFIAAMTGSITNAGPFDAVITFPSGLSVSWNGKTLGSIEMDNITVIGDTGADFNVQSQFAVADVDHLTEFIKVLVTEESFEWIISGENLAVSTLGIDVDQISLSDKTVTLKGMNNLNGGVTITGFNLPENDPDGGIHLTLDVTATNPSQVGITLGSIGFETYFDNVIIAPILSGKGLTLTPGGTSNLSLVGRLIPQDSDEGLLAVSTLFNNFIHGKDSNVIVHGDSAGPQDVIWLNEGIKSLQVASVLPNQGVLNIIQSVDLLQLEIDFTDDTAYNPATSSDFSQAAFTLPFAFPVDIQVLEQNIIVGYGGQDFAQLMIPKSPASTDVDARIITLSFSDVPFTVFDNAHSVFDSFLAATTMGSQETLTLTGSANADASTAVGLLSFSEIPFSVGTSIDGLQGLKARPVTVSDLDVNHGYPGYLLIKVNSILYDPSNLTIGTSDVSFLFSYQNQVIGTSNMADMVITPGNGSYLTDVHFFPQGSDAASAGRTLLENYIQGVDAETSITGSTDSTPIESLQTALSEIVLSPVTIPAMHDTLIKSASLTFPIDVVDTGIAQASFTLANPFTAGINLLTIGAIATYRGLTLGTIKDVDVSSNPIHVDGHSSVNSQSLDMKYNLDPLTIVQFLGLTAQANGVDLGPLVDMFQLLIANPDYNPPVTTTVDTQASSCSSGNQFDVTGAIIKALQNLQVDLAIDSSLKLDDFAVDLSFKQNGVPAITDETALYLIGAVAGPIAQNLVDASVLQFLEADISNISNDGLDLSLRGSLTGTGPLDALITFTEPVTINWEGHDIAQIDLDSICAAANDGVPNYETRARLTITDQSQFTQFAIYLLHNEEFSWTISTDKLRLIALGTIFDDVSLEKNLTFKAFNNLPGVTISNFGLPSDDTDGGIHIETDVSVPSPSQIGIDLGTVVFQSYYEGTLVGPLTATDFILTASSETASHFSGRIMPQSGDDLNTVGRLFSAFLAGENSTLITTGDSVQPSESTVDWLSAAFKTLSLNVILSGQIFNVIQSVELSDLEVTLQSDDQTWAPLTGSRNTTATYKNPFGFSLQVFEAAQNIVMTSSDGTEIASLTLPKSTVVGGVSTGNVANLNIKWENQPLKSLNDEAFEALFAAVTLLDQAGLKLKGTADVTAHTAIGNVPISSISLDVPSSLRGMNSFGGSATLSNVSVSGSGGDGGSEYIVSPLTTTIQNPSNVSLYTIDIVLPVMYEGVMIGRAAVDSFDLLPGEIAFSTEFHYQPRDANDTTAEAFLTRFLTTGDDIPLTIHGDAQSTPFTSLQEALGGLQLTTTLPGMGQSNIVSSIHVIITLDSLVTNLVTVTVSIHNPLDTPMVIEYAQSEAAVEGVVYASFGHLFGEDFVILPGETTVSPAIDGVVLTQGALASLDIIPLGYLDVSTANTVRIGMGGYQVPWLKLVQDHVPTTYDLDLSVAELKVQADSLSASSVEATASTSAPSDSSSSGTLTTVSSSSSVAHATAPVTAATDTSSVNESPAPTSSAATSEVAGSLTTKLPQSGNTTDIGDSSTGVMRPRKTDIP
ncbi:uncharacterized protein BT62DRAFT_931852 [Guyanagaster necrorhizus]|uniref:Uncharacterized protein n=1 Tax=Guyanagaster necrorhizus TaxID=856835 RepID=A0A9P7VT26_9AGAR|nr:uncharacterized protein BT62DRAFT_931852 [Guyanagaster necrorhizus MCA 3950]KAG7446409.1 hypothetical protein BT62DRAFT_931852 [Guyanagaster necrorhizus MCA 3950]